MNIERAPLLQSSSHASPSIGVITALEEEYAAMKVLLRNGRPTSRSSGRRSQEYWLGEVVSERGGNNLVVLTLAAIGTNIAATRAERLLRDFPSITHLIMTGIGGGCPNELKLDESVRLGDLVVSGSGGIVQYDFNKETSNVIEIRNPPRPPSAVLLDAVRLLKAAEHEGSFPWLNHLKTGLEGLKWKRPKIETDPLSELDGRPRQVRKPKVFIAPIASANKLLKNPTLRDALRDEFGVRAVEMESSGIADASWDNEIGYLAIRGICDYCDSNKDDVWHKYAAMVAAAYTVSLISSLPVDLKEPAQNESPAYMVSTDHPSGAFIPRWIENLGGGSELEMVTLSGAAFLMGSPEDRFLEEDLPQMKYVRISRRKIRLEINYIDKRAESPAHTVQLSNFAIGKYPINQKQWKAVMGSNPSEHVGDDRPVDNVSWEDAQKFCKELRSLTGKNYRLPTESQWEYACRGGIYDEYGFAGHENQLSDYAWFDNNRQDTAAVGLKRPNGYGIHDMHGNVWEWCSDFYAEKYYRISPRRDPMGPRVGQYRVLRGGSFTNKAEECRSAFRFYQGEKIKNSTYGFRVALPSRETHRLDKVSVILGKGDSPPINMTIGGSEKIEVRWFEPSIAMAWEISDETPGGATDLGMSSGKQIILHEPMSKSYAVSLAAMILTQIIRNRIFSTATQPLTEEDAISIVKETMLLNDFQFEASNSEIKSMTKSLRAKKISMRKLMAWIDERTIDESPARTELPTT
jgi:formylglycine-generating enzyme required for sulfatase activity/nucleoside phosphorylase